MKGFYKMSIIDFLTHTAVIRWHLSDALFVQLTPSLLVVWWLYMARFNFLQFPNSKILSFVDFEALDPRFPIALEPKVLMLERLSFGNSPSICVLKG